MSSLTTCDLVSHDRHRHDPLPHRRTPGVVGQVRPQGQAVRRQSKPGTTGRGNPWPASTLGEAGIGAARTKTFLRSRYHRLARRRGKQRALVASATPSSPSPGTCCRTRNPLHRPRTRLARPAHPLRRKRQLTAELQRLSGKKVLLQQEATA